MASAESKYSYFLPFIRSRRCPTTSSLETSRPVCLGCVTILTHRLSSLPVLRNCHCHAWQSSVAGSRNGRNSATSFLVAAPAGERKCASPLAGFSRPGLCSTPSRCTFCYMYVGKGEGLRTVDSFCHRVVRAYKPRVRCVPRSSTRIHDSVARSYTVVHNVLH